MSENMSIILKSAKEGLLKQNCFKRASFCFHLNFNKLLCTFILEHIEARKGKSFNENNWIISYREPDTNDLVNAY